jgi:hypothetical protein
MRKLTIVLMVAAAMPLWAADPGTPTVDDLAWLAGSWSGEAFGGTFEETWNPPSGGTMVGMFKLLRNGRPEMYELMRIAEVDGQIVLEVKHFSDDFTAWEAADESVRFPLLEARDGYAAFDGLVFERQDDGSIVARLAMRDGDTGEVRTEMLVFRPVP